MVARAGVNPYRYAPADTALAAQRDADRRLINNPNLVTLYPHNVYERLRDDFRFEERGDVAIKGRGVMHAWYVMVRTQPSRFGTTDS